MLYTDAFPTGHYMSLRLQADVPRSPGASGKSAGTCSTLRADAVFSESNFANEVQVLS